MEMIETEVVSRSLPHPCKWVQSVSLVPHTSPTCPVTLRCSCTGKRGLNHVVTDPAYTHEQRAQDTSQRRPHACSTAAAPTQSLPLRPYHATWRRQHRRLEISAVTHALLTRGQQPTPATCFLQEHVRFNIHISTCSAYRQLSSINLLVPLA